MIASPSLTALQAIIPPDQILTDPVELATYEKDASLDRGTPDAVVFVHTTEEIARVVAWANAHAVPLIARGAGTGLSGGAVAERGGIIVEFARMNRILELDAVGRRVVVQPGVVNLVLDEFVRAHGLYFPPDPASGRTATIGGNIAENAGGPHCFKYGVTTNYLTGLQVVSAEGRIVRLGGHALDYPEYDFIGLITGSEGTLALIAEASARVLRNPPALKTLMASFDSVEQAGAAVSAVIARGLVPATMEMMDRKMMHIIEEYAHAGLPIHAGAALIVEVDGYPESVTPQIEEIAAILRHHAAHDLRIAQTDAERERIWYGRKSAAGAMARLAPAYYLLDGTVPRSQLAATLAGVNALCDDAGLRVGYVFHAGDGNLHPFILIPNPDNADLMQRVLDTGEKIMRLCVEMGGSITGEHGIGIEKREFMPLMHTDAELAAMRDLQAVFDPHHRFNPGKIIPDVSGQTSEVRLQRSEVRDQPSAPQSAEEAARAVRVWNAAGKKILVRSRGSAPADGVLLSTKNLGGIRAYSLDDLYVTVGAGTRLVDLQAELARDRMWVPLVSPWQDATIGGILATNWNAPLRMRYGSIRDLTLAMQVVLPDGRVIRAGKPVVKNVAGYDLAKVFIGSYGTLGLIADATFKLAPLPRARANLVVPLDDLARGWALAAKLARVSLIASGVLVCRGCAVPGLPAPYALIYTVEGLAEDVNAEVAQVRAILRAENVTNAAQFDALSASHVWADWLGTQTEAVVRAGVAPKNLGEFVGGLAPSLGSASFIADIANGMLYVCGAPVAAVRQAALARGGYAIVLNASPDAADDAWGYAPESLDWMHALKARWDPRGVFNPGAFIV